MPPRENTNKSSEYNAMHNACYNKRISITISTESSTSSHEIYALRIQTLEDEIEASTQTLVESEPHEWRAWIMDTAGEGAKLTSLSSKVALVKQRLSHMTKAFRDLKRFQEVVMSVDQSMVKQS